MFCFNFAFTLAVDVINLRGGVSFIILCRKEHLHSNYFDFYLTSLWCVLFCEGNFTGNLFPP